MALCPDCRTAIPCHCHLAPPAQPRAGVYLAGLHTFADDLQIGDVIVHDDGETTVRRLDRTKPPTIVTNPGDDDQIDGYLWQHVIVRREAHA